MLHAGSAALFFTVLVLVTTAYFLLGGLPLLILAHDSPVDQAFIQRFFEIYYVAAIASATCAAISFAFWGRAAFALGNAVIVAVAWLLRKRIIPTMSQLAAQIQTKDVQAVRAFRKVHSVALGVNLVQLIALIWGLTRMSMA